MKKKIVVWTLVAVCLVTGTVLASCFVANSSSQKQDYTLSQNNVYFILEADKYIIKLNIDEWDNMDRRAMKYPEISDYLNHCYESIQFIEKETGRYDWMDRLPNRTNDGKAILMLVFGKDFTTYTKPNEGLIYMDCSKVESGMSWIEHELTHMIMGECNEGTLAEGIASYIGEGLMGVEQSITYGLNPDIFVQDFMLEGEYKDLYAEIMEAVGDARDPNIKHTEYGQTIYAAGYSYVKYLISTYGMDKFNIIYDAGGNEDVYKHTTGKTLEEIKSDWLEYLKEFDGVMSADEIYSYIFEHWNQYFGEEDTTE